MRFLIDECVVRYVASELRKLGADVKAVSETTPGINDEQVLQLSVDEQRILISEDYGFGRLIFETKLPAVGIVLVAPGTISGDLEEASADVASRILSIAKELPRHFTIIESARVRHHSLGKM